jgi:hypothetical protein
MAATPRQVRFPGRFEIRPTARYRRGLVAEALVRLALGALFLLALCIWLA